jgi:hypothetical protein
MARPKKIKEEEVVEAPIKKETPVVEKPKIDPSLPENKQREYR